MPCNPAKVIPANADIAIANHQNFVGGLVRQPCQIVQFAVRPELFNANDEAYRGIWKIPLQSLYQRDNWIAPLCDGEKNLETRIILPAKAGEILVRVAIYATHRFQNTNGRGKVWSTLRGMPHLPKVIPHAIDGD